MNDLEFALKMLANDPELADLWTHCSGPPTVLGTWSAPQQNDPDSTSKIANLKDIQDKRQFANFWVQVEAVNAGTGVAKQESGKHWLVPVLKHLYCCGYPYYPTSQIIFYKRPKVTSYLSIRPFTFDFSLIGNTPSSPRSDRSVRASALVKTDLDFILQQINISAKVEKLLRDLLQSAIPLEFLKFPTPPVAGTGTKSTSTEAVSSDLQLSKENEEEGKEHQPEESLFDHLKNRSRGRRMRRYQSGTSAEAITSEDYHGVDQLNSFGTSTSTGTTPASFPLLSSFLSAILKNTLRWIILPIHIFLLTIHIILSFISWTLNAPLPTFLGGGKVKHYSAFGRQLDWRIQELCSWPYMWLRTRGRLKNDAFSSSAFICFWGSVCQIAGDFLSGPIIGLLLHAYSAQVLSILHEAGQFLHVDVLRRQIEWLMGLPAGMKLNENLNHTLGSTVLYAIDFWNAITTVLTPFEPLLIIICSIIGLFGTSMILSFFNDLLSTMTVHIQFIHSAFSRLYSLELTAVSALWKLFRGKKRNVLRQRIDSCLYDMDQLLVGTILFTLLFFLFPTIGIYYVFFSFVRILIIGIQAGVWFLLAFLNYFPLFAAVLYFFDPERLPGGIWFEAVSIIDDSTASFLALQSHVTTSKQTELHLSLPGRLRPRPTYIILRVNFSDFCQKSVLILYQNRSVSSGVLFSQYRLVLQKLMAHYSLGKSFQSFLRGQSYPATQTMTHFELVLISLYFFSHFNIMFEIGATK